MAFEETIFSKAPRPEVSAAVSGASVESLRLRLSISAEGAKRLSLSSGQRAKVMVGVGGDAGKVRLLLCDDGPCQFNRIGRGVGMLVASCGGHASLSVPRKMAGCSVELISNEAIQVILPERWPEKPFGKAMGAAAHRQRDKAEPPPAPAPRPMQITENGITISFVKDGEHICVGRQRVDVTARQALAMQALARNLGKPIGRSWLMNELWSRPPEECHKQFDQLIRDLTDSVKKVGLQLIFSGTGYTLMRARGRK